MYENEINRKGFEKEEKPKYDLREYYILEKELLEKQEEKLRTFKPEVTEEMQDIEQRIASLNEEVKERFREMASLGLFKFNERKEILRKIADINNSIKTQKGSLAQMIEEQKNEIKERKNVIINRIMETLPAGFGRYNNVPIEWLVLDRKGTRVFMISKYILCVNPFDKLFKYLSTDEQQALFNKKHDKYMEFAMWEIQHCDWESCQLQGWLNCTFSKFAFIPEEAKIIEPETGIFLLSIEEAEQYFHSNSERICQLSKYHPDFKESKKMASAKGEWWLRSNGTSPGNAAYVCADGSINRDGKDAYANKLFGVRPAIWIDLQKLCKGIDL